MTRQEIQDFDAMVRRITRDCRRQLHHLKGSDSGTQYVMVLLQDVMSEIDKFVCSVKKSGNYKRIRKNAAR